MKKVLLLATAAFLIGTATQAQVQRPVRHSQKVQSDSSRHARNEKMANELDLSKDQQAQMKSLHQENKQQMEAIRSDASLTADQKKEKMKELRKSQSEKVNSILTPDQQVKRKTMIAERKQDHKMNGKKMHKKRNSDSTTVQ